MLMRMAAHTLGFAVADDDRERLDRLVARFGGGNRSAYLRATFKVMESLAIAEELRELQGASHRRMAESGIHTYEDALALMPNRGKGRKRR